MRTLLLSALALAFLALANLMPTRATAAPAGPLPGPGGVIDMHRKLFDAIDRGDGQAAASFASDRQDSVLFWFDEGGMPRSASGALVGMKVLAKLAADARAAGGSFATSITTSRADCPSGELSWCVLEFERKHATEAGTAVRRYRSTSLVAMTRDGFRLVHLHVSPADAKVELQVAAK